MMGTRQPNLSSVSIIFGTAAAACSVFTVTRTSSEPACARASVWLTVAGTSTVSVLVIDWMTIGCSPPTLTPPTSTTTAFRRGLTAIDPPWNLDVNIPIQSHSGYSIAEEQSNHE